MALSETSREVGTPDREDAVQYLLKDRVWAAYPLGYLDPLTGTGVDLHGLGGPRGLEAIVAIAHLPNLLNVFATGDPAAVADVLTEMPGLPASGVFSARAEVLDALERHLQVTTAYRMRRMAVRQEQMLPRRVEPTVRLSIQHLDQVRRLYGLWTDTHQLPGQLTDGIYYGVFAGNELIAAAGTHALSLRHGVGAIGNVLTHASHRGRGLASTTTTAVADELFARGCPEVVLNVRQGNDIALATYQKLGFRDHCTFIEGVFRKR
ncbi:MAG: GNAT family N-acetyltransferase [Candidatus Dormibacteria bacterium]